LVLKRISLLVGAIQELFDLVFKLAVLVVVRHEHDVLLEWVVTKRLSVHILAVVLRDRVHDGLRCLDLLNRNALSWINDADQGKLGVRFFEINGVF